MRLPGWLRGRPRGGPDEPSPVRPSDAAVSAPADPPDPGWRAVPAIQRTVGGSATDVAHLSSFGRTLASHQDPRFLEPLGHHVAADAPGGHVEGLATPAATSLPNPSPAARLVQRMTPADASPDENRTEAAVPTPENGPSPSVALPAATATPPTSTARTAVTRDPRGVTPVGTAPVQRTAGDAGPSPGTGPRGAAPLPATPSDPAPSAPSESSAQVPSGPRTAPIGTGLLGDEPLVARSAMQVGAPVAPVDPADPAEAADQMTATAQRAPGEPRPPVQLSRLARPPSTTGAMPAPEVRLVPTVDSAPDPGPPRGSDPVVAAADESDTPAPPTDVAEAAPAPEATTGLIGAQDLLVDVGEAPAEEPFSGGARTVDPGEPAVSPSLQRATEPPPRTAQLPQAEPPPRTVPPEATLRWPQVSPPEPATVAVLPRPPLVPTVGTAHRERGDLVPEDDSGTDPDTGTGIAVIGVGGVPSVQRAVLLPAATPAAITTWSADLARTAPTRPLSRENTATTAPTPAAPTPAAPTPAAPTPAAPTPAAPTPAAPTPVAPTPAALTAPVQRSEIGTTPRSPQPASPVVVSPVPVPLVPLPPVHRGALPPPATPLAPVSPDAPSVAPTPPGPAPRALQRLAGTGSGRLGDGVGRRLAPGSPGSARPSPTTRTGWTEVTLSEPLATGSAVPFTPPAATAVTLQRQPDGDAAPGPAAEDSFTNEPEASSVAGVSGGVASPAAPSIAAASPGAKAAELDELARRLYEPLTARLRAELWLDRERTGRSMTR